MEELKVTSSAFENSGMIPSKYTCDGIDVNPQLSIEGIPPKTKSLVLIMDDPDAPMGTWVHWVLWNIHIDGEIEENNVPGGAVQGVNSGGEISYAGPCPPSGVHRYFFKVYALDAGLDLDEGATKKEVENAMKGHILAKGELIGKYSR